MGLFGKRKRQATEEQASRLKAAVEKGSLSPDVGEERILSWGRGILQEIDPQLGPHVTDSVYVLTDKALHYQFLQETPKQLRSPRARASGVGPGDWREVARSSTESIAFASLEGQDAREAVDGRVDLDPTRCLERDGLQGLRRNRELRRPVARQCRRVRAWRAPCVVGVLTTKAMRTSETTQIAMAREPEDIGRTAFEADFFEHPDPTTPEEVDRAARDAGDRFYFDQGTAGPIAPSPTDSTQAAMNSER
jgi:hypothetical protein